MIEGEEKALRKGVGFDPFFEVLLAPQRLEMKVRCDRSGY